MPSKYGNSAFYNSKEWRRVSAAYMSSQHYICERCGQPAQICHHRIWLNDVNVHDPTIALNPENLEALCISCHNKLHIGKEYYRRNWHKENVYFDDKGNVVKDYVVYIVCGAPASGKSYYVNEHRAEGDLIFDLDLICSALRGEPEKMYSDNSTILDLALDIREAAYAHIEKRLGLWGKAWVITSSSDRTLWKALARRLDGKIIEMQATEEECIKRIERDTRRKNKRLFIDLVHKWYEEKEPSSVVS